MKNKKINTKNWNISKGTFKHVVPLKGVREGFLTPSYFEPSIEFSQMLIDKGMPYLHTSLWTSMMQPELLEENLHRVAIPDGTHAGWHLLEMPRMTMPRSRISLYTENYKTYLDSSTVLDTILGHLFCLHLAFDAKPRIAGEYETTVNKVINSLRLATGSKIAIKEKHSSLYNIIKKEAVITSNHETVMPEQGVNGFDGPTIHEHLSDLTLIQLKVDAGILFTAAMNANTNWQRFLFLWLCFEAQTSSDGSVRKKYILEILQSEIINYETKRLRDIRGDLAHGRIASVTSSDINSIMGLLRVTCITRENDLKSIVTAYENWINRV